MDKILEKSRELIDEYIKNTPKKTIENKLNYFRRIKYTSPKLDEYFNLFKNFISCPRKK